MQSSLTTQSITTLGLTPFVFTVSGQGDMLPMSSILKVRFLRYRLRTCCIVDYPMPLVKNNYMLVAHNNIAKSVRPRPNREYTMRFSSQITARCMSISTLNATHLQIPRLLQTLGHHTSTFVSKEHHVLACVVEEFCSSILLLRVNHIQVNITLCTAAHQTLHIKCFISH
eukprot:scaffold46316_cov15-Prasinocladus_malaysianus.AAC.1